MIAGFVGSFDPITLGHLDIIERTSKLFDKVYVGIGINAEKKSLLSSEEKLELTTKACKHLKNVEVYSYSGLTIDFVKTYGIDCLVRSIRSYGDFSVEEQLAITNKKLDPKLETLILVSNPSVSHISSSLVKDIWKHGGDISQFVPECVGSFLSNKKDPSV